jgi:hypothetical protein
MTLTIEERATMLELLDYPNPEGPHSNEARWREFARLEFAVYDQRIQQLEQLNATLATQIDRQAKVVDAALALAKSLRLTTDWTPEEAALEYVVRAYQQAMARLAKEG